jgi:hypothetical protein
MDPAFGRQPVFSPTLTDTNEIEHDERAKDGDARRAAATLLHAGAINSGQHRRILGALQSSSARVPWLTGLLVRAATDAGRRDVSGVLREITATLGEITADIDLGNGESEAAEYTSQGLCDQIPAEERHHYPYCSDAVPELSREIVEMIRMLGSGQNKVAIDRALKKRGYSRYELKNAASEFVQNVRRVFKTGSLFSAEAANHDTAVVHDTINDLLQNTDFVHHMMQLMAMHLPPDYQWRSDQIAHVCRWWIMHYISLVRPQLVHAVIECPTDSAMSCRLTGLGVNGGPPVATWQGSSSVVFKKSHVKQSYTDHLQRSGRYLQSYLRYQAHSKLLMSPTPSSVFAKLTPQQRIDARNIVNDANKRWRDVARGWKNRYFLVPGFVPYSHFSSADQGLIAACFDSYGAGAVSAEQIEREEKKFLQKTLGPSRVGAAEVYRNLHNQAFVLQPDQSLPFATAGEIKDARQKTPDSVVWWYVKLNPAMLDNPQYFFEVLDDVKFLDQELRRIPQPLLALGNLFSYTQDEAIYDTLSPTYHDIVAQFQANARRVASRVSMVCSKANRAYVVSGAFKADTKSDHSAHSAAAGMKLLLFLAHYGARDNNGNIVTKSPVDDFTTYGIEEMYSQMKANGVALEDTAVPSNVETKAVFDSVYATTPEDDTSVPAGDSLSTEQWIARLEDAFDKNVVS